MIEAQFANSNDKFSPVNLGYDFIASIVVFLVAVPLCLGIALASGAPPFSGLLAGIIGGIIVGSLSGSHTSVSGPAAGLTAVVATQISSLGSFDIFLFAVAIGGLCQIGLGIARAGFLSAFFPSSVIKGLLAAIGIILILKQIPHLLGNDKDPDGEMSFAQPDAHNTLTELATLFEGQIHFGAAVIGIVTLLLMIGWERISIFKKSGIPAPLVVVLAGVGLQMGLSGFGKGWRVGTSHLVKIPVAESWSGMLNFLQFPDFSQWANPAVYIAGVTIALVASLETLLNLEATDEIDPQRRISPASRELVAQGVGNLVGGLLGAIPVTSVIVRGSVNINMGAKSKLSTIFHGILLLVCVALFPVYLNKIPLAALAAILIVTGFKLASPKLFQQMWQDGRYQFLPFLITLLAIVFTDLLIGITVGLGVSVLFILNSNLRRPIRQIVETHIDGDIIHIELANQVSFLNRASLQKVFNSVGKGQKLLIDASASDYIDPDIQSLIREFKDIVAPARGVSVNLQGFRSKYDLQDEIKFADYSTRELKDRIKAEQVLKILRDGNLRFQSGNRLNRDFGRQIDATSMGQNPLAVVLSCIDSRVPTELVFDLGIGDIFSVRVAGNIVGTKTLGSIEYGIVAVGVKLVLVMGHTRCGAVTSSVQLLDDPRSVEEASGCRHLPSIVHEIQQAIPPNEGRGLEQMNEVQRDACLDRIARLNVERSVQEILNRSPAIAQAVNDGNVMVVGALYDVKSGAVEFF